jgi:hypothetical protein
LAGSYSNLTGKRNFQICFLVRKRKKNHDKIYEWSTVEKKETDKIRHGIVKVGRGGGNKGVRDWIGAEAREA